MAKENGYPTKSRGQRQHGPMSKACRMAKVKEELTASDKAEEVKSRRGRV